MTPFSEQVCFSWSFLFLVSPILDSVPSPQPLSYGSHHTLRCLGPGNTSRLFTGSLQGSNPPCTLLTRLPGLPPPPGDSLPSSPALSPLVPSPRSVPGKVRRLCSSFMPGDGAAGRDRKPSSLRRLTAVPPGSQCRENSWF